MGPRVLSYIEKYVIVAWYIKKSSVLSAELLLTRSHAKTIDIEKLIQC